MRGAAPRPHLQLKLLASARHDAAIISGVAAADEHLLPVADLLLDDLSHHFFQVVNWHSGQVSGFLTESLGSKSDPCS